MKILKATSRGTAFRVIALTALLANLVGLSACQSTGEPRGDLRVEPVSDANLVLRGDFDQAVYAFDNRDRLTIVLLDGDIAAPEQAVVIRTLWRPRAGATPIDPNATNATIDYLIAADDQTGLYRGAGFVWPKDKGGKDTLRVSVWDANLKLASRTDRFYDRLGPAILTGNATVVRNDAHANQLASQIRGLIHHRLAQQ